MKKVVLVLLCFLSLVSCKKEQQPDHCRNLVEGITAGDTERVKDAVNSIIGGLPDKEYNSRNLAALAQAFSLNCGIRSEVLCFDCISTLPSQSEIRVHPGGSAAEKIIDITYTPAGIMTFRNMHE